ncbi:AraC family transcriptional regulator [Xanthomonas arboricola]|uniref:AraC family transcriptional regulator n=1 Tax=Xanthomonas arboricola TaxID=56448 RepID=UPI00142FD0BB|nr:AraC family transcriptional regulator [Xanthomonas arboricola]NJB93203.1 AraC-like DNA-binding protein [Xanthomonas arboricola]
MNSKPLTTSPALAALAQTISGIAHTDGDHATAISGLTVHRRNAPTKPLHCIYTLAVGVVVQGAKQVMQGEEVMTYSPGQSMLTTIDLPVISHVTQASIHAPFLGLMLTLDSRLISEMASEMELPPRMKEEAFRTISIETLDDPLVDALNRLLGLQKEPKLLPLLAPLIQKEITARLMTGPHAPHLHHLATTGSPSQHIAKAVAWLKQNFTRTLQMDDLAARAHMSASTFRLHFRAITGTSPLQYQKQLRLQEARQLMLNQNVDASNAASLVGYESASQFSREYSRLFGAPPQQDARRLRLS